MEIWKSIPGVEFYEASSAGRVRSLDRKMEDGRSIKGRALKPYQMPSGYWQVAVGRGKKRYVHRLVCAAFHGEAAAGLEVSHQDGDKSNNAATNLCWVTHAENEQRKREHGTYARPRVFGQPHHKKRGPAPSRHPDADRILEMRRQGMTLAAIAVELGMSKSGVHGVIKCRT